MISLCEWPYRHHDGLVNFGIHVGYLMEESGSIPNGSAFKMGSVHRTDWQAVRKSREQQDSSEFAQLEAIRVKPGLEMLEASSALTCVHKHEER